MDAPEESALTAKAEELYGIRRDLVRYLSGLPASGSVIDLQRLLLGEHTRTSQTQADRDLLKQHRSKLRAIGDALAWRLLPAHTIRTLAKHPGRPAALPVDTDDAAFVVHVVERLFSAGRVPIVSDLTNVLLVGDIVAVGPGNMVEVVECKNTRIPTRLPSSGRLARQRQRGETLARYLRDSVMPIAEQARQIADALGIPAAARPSPAAANLVAMDVDLPEPHPEWLETAYVRYKDSPNGVGLVKIGSGDYLLIADGQAVVDDGLGGVMAALLPLRQGYLSIHQEQLTDPAPCCRSILSYPLDWELLADLLEMDLVMIRLVDLAIFEERGDDGVGLTLQDDLSLLWTRGGYNQRFSERFVEEVLTGPVSAAEMRDCLLDVLRYSKRELAPLVMDRHQAERSDEVGRGVGTDVRYSTVYPASDGEVVLVWSAADAGLAAVPEATHAECYPATQRLIVFAEDGVLLDTELPVTD
jgi:hypothetical protein